MDKTTALDIIKLLSVMESLCLRANTECPEYVMDQCGQIINILSNYILDDNP